MTRKVLLGALVWAVLITAAHVQLNVGWGNLARKWAVATGQARRELIIGFLPVT